MTVTVLGPRCFMLGALVFMALSTSGCFSLCSSCVECQEDVDCDEGKQCTEILGICEEICDEHLDCDAGARCDLSSGECTSVDACTSDDQCANFTICDFNERLCVPDACETDDDCELEEPNYCDVEQGICVFGVGDA